MKMVSKILGRSENSCYSKLTRLKNDIDMKYTKLKKTNHKRKVDDVLREELKQNLINEIPQLNR